MYFGKPILSHPNCSGRTYLAIVGPFDISDFIVNKVRRNIVPYVRKVMLGAASSEVIMRPSWNYTCGDRLNYDGMTLLFGIGDTGLDEFLMSCCPEEGSAEHEKGKAKDLFRWVKRAEVLTDDLGELQELFERFNSISSDVKAAIYTNLPFGYYDRVPPMEIERYKAATLVPLSGANKPDMPLVITDREARRRRLRRTSEGV